MRQREHAYMPVEALQEGWMVDLASDDYAVCEDPDCNDHLNSIYWYEYGVVVEVEQETPTCTAVTFEQDWIGFPHGHLVRVVKSSMKEPVPC